MKPSSITRRTSSNRQGRSAIVLASVPEDDLPALQELKDQTRNHVQWTVHTVGSKPIEGLVDDIGYLIDPNQHTAVVRGHIPNPDGMLRAGQFVTAAVDRCLQGRGGSAVSALVEDGKDSIVFVQTDPKEPVYTMRRVEVANRFDRTAYVRMRTRHEETRGARQPETVGEDPRQRNCCR